MPAIQDPRPTEPTDVAAAIWQTSQEETCVVTIAFAKQVHIYGSQVNVVVVDQANWEHGVPPNHTCTILRGRGVTFKVK